MLANSTLFKLKLAIISTGKFRPMLTLQGNLISMCLLLSKLITIELQY